MLLGPSDKPNPSILAHLPSDVVPGTAPSTNPAASQDPVLALRIANQSDTQSVQARAFLFAQVNLLLLFSINTLLSQGGPELACECGRDNGFAERGISMFWGQKPALWFAQVQWQ